MTEKTLREKLADVVAANFPHIDQATRDQLAEAAAGMKIDPEVMQTILDAIDAIVDAFRILIEGIKEVITAIAGVIKEIWETVGRARVPPKWWHLYKHAKKARVRKKYGNRIRREIFAALT